MKSRKRALGAVFVLLSLPLLVAAVEILSFEIQNRNNGSIVSSDERREYLLYVPESYDSSKPAPLVISLHGGGGWPVLQREVSGWNRLAERHGFIVAYPSGLQVGGVGGMRGWRVNRPGTGLVKDVRFISDLIEELGSVYNIDPAKIYANGLSNGAGMAFVLSCALADRIAAVGLVAAAHFLPSSWCQDPRPVPMISFHGTADSAAPYEGGTTWVSPDSLPGILDWTADWARRNRCDPMPVESTTAADVTRRDYQSCANGADVVLFTIHGGGHTWPGGDRLAEWFLGPTSTSIDATHEMWEFFRQHDRPPLRRSSSNFVDP